MDKLRRCVETLCHWRGRQLKTWWRNLSLCKPCVYRAVTLIRILEFEQVLQYCVEKVLALFTEVNKEGSMLVSKFLFVKAMLVKGDYMPWLSASRCNLYNRPGHRDYSWRALFSITDKNFEDALKFLKDVLDDKNFNSISSEIGMLLCINYGRIPDRVLAQFCLYLFFFPLVLVKTWWRISRFSKYFPTAIDPDVNEWSRLIRNLLENTQFDSSEDAIEKVRYFWLASKSISKSSFLLDRLATELPITNFSRFR